MSVIHLKNRRVCVTIGKAALRRLPRSGTVYAQSDAIGIGIYERS